MPFGESTAKYLMQTAAHPVLSNRHYSGDLPASWRTLSLLAQLPVADTEALIASGDINPELGQLQARALVAGHRDPDPVIDPVRPRDGTCRAVIQIASVRYGCDLSAPHAGWAHFCEDADAYWCSDGEARHVKAVS